MARKINRFLFNFGIFFCFLCFFPLFSRADSGNSAANFLRLGLGARPTSMADSFVGLPDDANTMVYNPAGLSMLTGGRIDVEYIDLYQLMGGGYFSFASPYDTGGFGINLFYLSASDQYRDINGLAGGEFSNADWSGSIGASRLLWSRFSIGGDLKVVQEQIADTVSTVFALDVGVMLKAKKSPLCLGLALQNVGIGEMKYVSQESPLPTTGRGGGSWVINGNDNIITIGAEADYQVPDARLSIQGGAEYSILLNTSSINFRGGYKWMPNVLGGMTGATFGLGFGAMNQEINYSFIPMGDLGNVQHISINLAFAGAEVPQAKPTPTPSLEAVATAKKKEEENKKAVQAQNLLKQGVDFFQKGADEEALNSYNESIQLNPNFAMTYQFLGDLYLKQNKFTEAIVAYEKSLALDPNNPLLSEWLKKWKVEHPTTATGKLIDRRKAIELYSTGLKFYQQKDYDGAVASLLDSIDNDDTMWQSYEVLGHCYLRKGQKSEAFSSYNKSLLWNPGNAELKDWMEKNK